MDPDTPADDAAVAPGNPSPRRGETAASEEAADDLLTLRARLPGLTAGALMLLTVGLWTFWGFMEMYYEGWGQPGLTPLAYLIPGVIFLLLTLAAQRWPRAGGVALVVVGGLFTLWWWGMQAARSGLSLRSILSMFPVSGLVVITGVLFMLEGRRRRALRRASWTPAGGWIRRNMRYLTAVGVFVTVGLGCSAWYAPILLSRVDDGYRGAAIVEGNGVTLVWAPDGPGWSRGLQDSLGSLSWNEIACYGMPPVGFGEKPGTEDRFATGEEMERFGMFRYLSADGTTLCEEPQDIWRMPTTEEIVRSLVHHGGSAGCVPGEVPGRVDCSLRPDKETPLWAPDWSPIYLWAADEHDSDEAYYVSYNGWIGHQPKDWGNPRHGHRFVREPQPGDEEAIRTYGASSLPRDPR